MNGRQLVLNKNAAVRFQRTNRIITRVLVQAPVRGGSLRITSWAREENGSLVDALAPLANGGDLIVSDKTTLGRFTSAGLLVDDEHLSVPVRIECPFEETYLDCEAPSALDEAWRLNPTVRFPLKERTREGLARVIPSQESESYRGLALARSTVPLPPGVSWVWFEGAATGWLSGYSVASEIADQLQGLSEQSTDLPLNLHPAAQAGLLVHDGAYAERRARLESEQESVAEVFERNRYARIPRLLEKPLADALKLYYRALVNEGYCHRGDNQVANRFTLHNEPFAILLHEALTPIAARLARQALKPSYVYFASYFDEAALEPHVDRAQCEVSMSLLIDYKPLAERALSPWPLIVKRPEPDAPEMFVNLSPGDAVAYRGCELLHYRPALPAGHTSTSLFLHWVPAAFEGPLD